MKPLKEKRLLNQIVYHNTRIIVFFVLVIWVCITLSLCVASYQADRDKNQELLHQFADHARLEIDRAGIHTEQIVKSSYITTVLQNENLSTVEKLEFFDYTKDILSSNLQSTWGIMIYHTNESLYESRFFSYIYRLPGYESILQQFRETNAEILFDKTVTTAYETGGLQTLTMYRRIPWNSENILKYPIVLSAENEVSSSILVVHSSTAMADMDSYFRENINNEFLCLLPIPKAEIFLNLLKVFLLCLLILCLLIFTIMEIAKRTAKQTLKEINDFIETLNDESLLQDDKIFSTTYDLYELNVIQKTLQKLVNDTKNYTRKLQSAELENKQLELDRLAMQLDPHMLYNSLASIRLDAYREKNKKILDLVDNMAMYYRSVLKRDQKYIFLQNELETIKKYLYINELSQNKTFTMETVVDDSLLKLLIPPQFLHTFVENSIVHGLSGLNRECIIRIQVTEENGIVTVEIYDNGYGISPEKLAALNEGTLLKDHVGIDNSIKRLKLVYGEESSIRFESEKNVYTRVIIQFRKLPDLD